MSKRRMLCFFQPTSAFLEYELQGEISGILIQNYVCGLHHEFETKLWEHQNCISTLNRNWAEKVSEIAVLRDELHNVLSVILASEPGAHHPHQSHGVLEDQMVIVKAKDDGEPPVTEKCSESSEVTLEIPDFSLLKHMPSEEMTNFLKTEWLKLRRQHESELHEKTEELFRVKREHAKEKASLPLKKERELEFIKSKLLQTISKLGEIASRKENSCFDGNENKEMRRLKDRIGMLLHDNNRLRGLLADKKQEVKHLSLQVSDSKSKTTQDSLSEAKLLNNFEKLRAELEDLKVERHLNNLVDSSVFKEVFDNYENQIYDMDQEGSFLKELLDEKQDQLSIIYEDRQKLKYENNQLVSIAESIMQHHDQANLVNDELMMFKEKVCEQELLILESKGEYNSMKRCLYEAMQEIQVCKQEILGLTENLTFMSIALKEAKEQNASLDATIREMKKTPAQSIGSHWGQTGEFDLASMEKLSKTYADFESRLVETIKRNETRLTSLVCQFSPLVQQVAVLRKKEFWYKQILEIKCSNLRKAEAEVDILGDEVDTLLSVLGKIYIALDHYSPVLKHYPGVTEILMLVQKVLKGESIEHLATKGKS
ncbi:WPP domain-associated protein isoform X1 [Sorghum bicolor]|uniref:WPP domain-associated protein isoform X1 n=1 Tax=Sorghum bicolor TaxID=4558 RepID=UPI000B426C0C|nr:WPP domain-associated protein isoform X1 [Sorghum bicolor]|eukprot:XP_021302203.1 WPP domain-associated protein isoform X1 [Sorghum bicolor]